MDSLNRFIFTPNGISISGNIQGGLLTKSLGIQHLNIRSDLTGDTLITADQVSVLGMAWDWSTRELTLQNLEIDSYFVHSENLTQITRQPSGREASVSTIIQNIRASRGQLSFENNDTSETIIIPELYSTLWYIDGFVDTKIHKALAIAPTLFSDSLSISGLVGIEDEGEVKIRNLSLSSPRQKMTLDLDYGMDNFTASITGSQVDPHAFPTIKLPSRFSDLLLNFDMNLKKDKDYWSMSGKGRLLLNKFEIPFTLNHLKTNQAEGNLSLTMGRDLQTVNILASRSASGEETAQIKLFRFDLSPLINDEAISITEPLGMISVKGTEGHYNIAVGLESFRLNQIKFDTLKSDLNYSVNEGLFLSNGMVTQANNRMTFEGKLSRDLIDIEGNIEFSDFSLLDVAGPAKNITGDISSHFNISESMSSPRITADIHPNSLSFNHRLTFTGDGKVDLSIKNRTLQGNMAIVGTSGFFFEDSLTSYNILGSISEDGFFIEDFHLQSFQNLISISGGYVHKDIILNKLNMIKGENQLKLADTLLVRSSPDGLFHIPSSVLTFNNGGLSIEGSYSSRRGLALHSEFELIDVARILDFFRLKVDFSGIAAGTATISGSLSDPIIDTKLVLNHGVALGYPSDLAQVDLRLTSSEVISNNIDAFIHGGSLNLVGKLPWGYKISGKEIGNTTQNFAINTDNYLLKDLKFTSIAGMPISGRATGSISIRGTPLNTKLDVQLALSNAAFDTLKFAKAYTELSYEGNLITFDTLSMVSTWGYGSGSGFMPMTLDLMAKDRMSVATRDMGLDFDFNLSEMPFLTSYISSIDAIQGDFIGQLSLTGPFSAPIRNGKLRGHDGRLEISVLGNPITNIHSEVTVIDNTLSIDHFSGRMNFSEGSNLNTKGAVGWLASKAGDLIGVKSIQKYAGVVNAEGTVDLHSFFKPRFDIHLKANEVYYRSTDGLIEAIANADLKFTGQDTLNVEAVIPVLRAGYYANFESETSYDERVSHTDSSIFKYSLNTQFASDLLISNDQMEAEFEGELWLLDYGDGIMRFTGTLTVIEGGKFYYLGNELTLLTGEIIFNSVDFNPQISMEAEIDIEGERVRLILSGDLDEPELVINTENAQLTQSDVLTYLTLNKTLVEVSFDQSALDPVKSYSEILVQKQISKLGREYIGLDLVGVDLASDSTSNARLHLGQRLSKNLMVTYEGAIQPTGGESDYDFGFEYQINRNVSVTSKINKNGEVELNGRLKFTY
ncbi:MAG: translocation/assembly module TamB [Candidatus Marinimicrobia bacterium]|nr:translocation/assembly module TamB [Candidatus Neomarinimicrobiota bacterium]